MPFSTACQIETGVMQDSNRDMTKIIAAAARLWYNGRRNTAVKVRI